MPQKSLLVLLAVVISSFGVVQSALATDPAGGTGGGPIAGSLQVQVIHAETGEPFAGAFVMVGPRPGIPFAGNWAFTGADGVVTFAHPDLVGPLDVTAGAAGRCYLTLVNVDACDIVLPLRPIIDTDPTYEVGDYVSGIDVDNGTFHYGDGYVDMALVFPALRLDSIMSFNMAGLMGPPEIIEILGQPFEIPSNVFLPQQWEMFVEIIKDHYYLYLEPGNYTLAAMSGRVPLDALLSGGDIVDLISQISWRETDILDVTVSGPTYTADLYVDPDLVSTVTLNLANIPDNSTAWGLSVGDLDNLAGLGRLVMLGVNSFACPAGSGGCGGAMSLTTTAASGDFAGMGYFPAVAIQKNDSNDALVLLQRAPHPQSYSENMSSYFHLLDLSYDMGNFFWNDVANPAAGSPPVHISMARIASTTSNETYWEFMVPGGELSFCAPGLPPEAPPAPAPGSIYTWQQVATGLGYDLTTFDFNNFAFSDLMAHGSHLALDQLDVPFYLDPAAAPTPQPVLAGLQLAVSPNPFGAHTALRFTLERPASVDLGIFGLDGRRIATIFSGQRDAGEFAFDWDGADDLGRRLPSGAYFARLLALGRSESRILVLQR